MENVFNCALRKDEYVAQKVFNAFTEFLLKDISAPHIDLVIQLFK